jgi:hypothetical protein
VKSDKVKLDKLYFFSSAVSCHKSIVSRTPRWMINAD